MKYLFAFLAFMIICLGTWAVDIEAPNTIYLYDEAKEVNIRLTNDSDSSQDFSIEFSAPTQFELSAYSGTIPAGKSKNITLTLFPRSDLEGQTYESKLDVEAGSSRKVKMLHIVFRGTAEKGEEETGNGEDGTEIDAVTGFFTMFAMPEITSGLLLNSALALIAAVLLIAFIARFVKRMEGR